MEYGAGSKHGGYIAGYRINDVVVVEGKYSCQSGEWWWWEFAIG